MRLCRASAWGMVAGLALAGALCTCAMAQVPDTKAALPSNATQQPAAGNPAASTTGKQPVLPKDGDKLGYSREESIRRLTPEVRMFLDGILRLYKETGLLARRREAFAALGTEPGRRRELDRPVPKTSATDPFRQYAAPKGLFSQAGWAAAYTYSGREAEGTVWRARLDIDIPSTPCIDSRAVEGYLDLYLHTGLEGKPHPASKDLWDRHGAGGSPFAVSLGSTTPGISLGFVSACLVRITLAHGFTYKEISDDNVLN